MAKTYQHKGIAPLTELKLAGVVKNHKKELFRYGNNKQKQMENIGPLLDRRSEITTMLKRVEFDKGRCKVLQLGTSIQECRDRLGSTWLGSSCLRRDLAILVDNKLNMSEHFAGEAKEVSRVLGYVNKVIRLFLIE